jgi:hypothetical protein
VIDTLGLLLNCDPNPVRGGQVGSVAEAHRKLEPRAAKCVFLGYGEGVKGYKLWNPETKKSMLSRSVVFNEPEMYYANRVTNAHDDVP